MAIVPVPNKKRRLMQYPIADAESWTSGAIVLLSSGELTQAGADPAVILGFAQTPTGLDPDIYAGRAIVAVAGAGSTFWMEGSAAPVAGDIGVAYEITVDGDVAIVDKSATTATRLTVVDVDLDRNLFEVEVIAANRQLDG